MIRRPPRSTPLYSSAASDVYKRQHDIGVIANIADRVAVMYGGSVVETGKVHQILTAPEHEYTKSLIAAVPRGDIKFERLSLIHISEPTRLLSISYAVFCLKKKKKRKRRNNSKT